ncbi:MAG: hypothetical protein QOG23_2375 [Blastocatellia bacterium]|jgi:predicted nucleic acid-binding protein|nr:hypothetical protein [Blastocatellia bacterium]
MTLGNDSSAALLSIDDKREVIYAALLRFNPEAMELRQRGLDRVVLSGLIGSSEEDTYAIDKIQKNLKKRPQAPELRIDLIRDTLHRLFTEEKVSRFLHKSSKSYCLTVKGADEIDTAIKQAVDIFQPALVKMLINTSTFIEFDLGASICRAFITNCFARFGRQIARSVMGKLDRDDLAKSSDVQSAFRTVSAGKSLSVEAYESLYHRCVLFIRSTDAEDERLKLRLTQAFFLAELLCVEGAPFDPLSRQAFNGSVFYLDTNIIFIGLLATNRQADLFGEMLRLSARLGIELRVTRATINEARRVVANRRNDLEKYLGNVPSELNELTHDAFLLAYQYMESLQPNLTPEQFFERFERLTHVLQDEWKIQIDDRDEDEILGKEKLDVEAAIMQDEARHSRRATKSEQVLRHDLAQFRRRRARTGTLKLRWTMVLSLHAKGSASGLRFCGSRGDVIRSQNPV